MHAELPMAPYSLLQHNAAIYKFVQEVDICAPGARVKMQAPEAPIIIEFCELSEMLCHRYSPLQHALN